MANNKKFVVKNGLQTQTIDFVSSNNTQNVSFYDDTLTLSGNVQVTGSLKDSSSNSGISGYILSSTANGITWISPSTISGSSIAVKDEGSTLTNTATSLNFTGSGVTASAVGNDITVNISGGGGGSSIETTVVSANTQLMAINNRYVLANATTTTATLPATPSSGDTVYVVVANGLVTNIVARNSSKIQGLEEDLILDIANLSLGFCYTNSTLGWRII